MSMRTAIATLLAGERTPRLLHNARLEAFGSEHYGEEAILEQFRAQPHDVSDGAAWVETSNHVALFDGAQALIADVNEKHLLRLWRLGPGGVVTPEPRIDVAFDPDLTQRRGDLMFRAEDHPDLSPELLPLVEEAGLRIVKDRAYDEVSAYRVRAFLVRAFGPVTHGAALFAVHRLGAGTVRSSGFANVVARVGDRGVKLVYDAVGLTAVEQSVWRPRF